MAATYCRFKSQEFFRILSIIIYLCGLPNFWIHDLNLPARFIRFHNKFCKIFNIFLYFFVLVQMLSVFTQHNLTEKQQSYHFILCASHPFVVNFPTMMAHHKHKIQRVLLELTVKLKQVHNDLDVETQMIKQIKYYSIALTTPFLVSMVFYCIDSYVHVLKTGTTFNIIILAWPLVEDHSTMASAARFIYHIIWIMFGSRVTATYLILISLSTCISCQYKNLQSYFGTLDRIFIEKNLTQKQKERKYENVLKIGIQAHSETLRVTKEGVDACSGVLSTQVIFNIVFLVMLMYQTVVVNENRSLMKLISTLGTVATLLFSTWFFTCNAGDVTYEASHIGTAMYASGWQNCTGVSLVRVRKLLVTAISCAQQPVLLKGFGVLTLSHQTFLSIVKFSYSVFSLLY